MCVSVSVCVCGMCVYGVCVRLSGNEVAAAAIV